MVFNVLFMFFIYWLHLSNIPKLSDIQCVRHDLGTILIASASSAMTTCVSNGLQGLYVYENCCHDRQEKMP